MRRRHIGKREDPGDEVDPCLTALARISKRGCQTPASFVQSQQGQR